MPTSSKSFNGLERDYAFFESSVNERECTLARWAPLLGALTGKGPLRVLDFGCGTGGFTLDVLSLTDRAPQDIHLTFVEPSESLNAQAWQRFRKADLGSLDPLRSVGELKSQRFDLIFSHHVLYYVPHLREVFELLRGLLDPAGQFLAVVGDNNSGPGRLQDQVLAQAGLSSPYHSGGEIQRLFTEVFPRARTERFETRLQMDDSVENRESIMRFLVGEFGASVCWSYALSVFDQFSDGKRIVVPSEELNLFLG